MNYSDEELVRKEGIVLKSDHEEVRNFIDRAVKTFRVVIISKTYCPYCDTVKKLFEEFDGVKCYVLELDKRPELEETIKDVLYEKTGMKTVPNVFVSGTHVGGCDKTSYYFKIGRMHDLLDGNIETFDYDLIVIGAGSGGISAAKEAARLGKSVAIFNYVHPTKRGCRWGVGGTCVNVGCVPKKLFHQAALVGNMYEDGPNFGWRIQDFDRFDWLTWSQLVNNVQNYIKNLNLNYLKMFVKAGIKYHNKYASFIDKHTIEAGDDLDERKTKFTAQNFIIATGTKPFVPKIPGYESGLTSDDIFFLKDRPKKVLIVGASYIALECAGFLRGLGSNVTVAVRSKLLRGFDQEIAEKIGEHMNHLGIRFMRRYVVASIAESVNLPEEHKYTVTLKRSSIDEGEIIPPTEASEITEQFSVVMFATGRRSRAKDLKVDQAGVTLNDETFKIKTDSSDRTTCRSIYAVGDVADGRPELTPVAIKAGNLVARRLYTDSTELMDYDLIPTTVFTPLEYSCVGFSEEGAAAKYGLQNIACFENDFHQLEWKLAKRKIWLPVYAKMVCRKDANLKVVGLHYFGSNAGEVMQGFALAVKLGCTKNDMDHLLGIPPSCAEIFTKLSYKRKLSFAVENAATNLTSLHNN